MPTTHTHAGKVMNDYATVLHPDFYRHCPKAVFAAMAVSYASQGGEYLRTVQARLLNEWDLLHRAGIVKQKPLRTALAVAEEPHADR